MELLVVVAVLLAVFGLALLLRIKDQRQAAAKKLDQLTAATRGYIEALEQNRVFAPVVAVPGLHLEQKEFAVRCDRATLAEFRQARIGGGVGTRVRIGSLPIYLGGWKSVPKGELREVGAGELVLTNRRLLFLGAHTLAIPLGRLLKCQQIDAGLLVSESRKKNPVVFLPENPGLWYFLVNWVADNRFEEPKLPDGVHISVTGKAPNLRIEIIGGAKAPIADAPTKRGILGTPSQKGDGNQNLI